MKLQGANNTKKIPSDEETEQKNRGRFDLETARMNKPPIQRPSTS